jgi:hypothetical protein
MHYGPADTTLGEKIVTVIGFLFLSTMVAGLMVAWHWAGIA